MLSLLEDTLKASALEDIISADREIDTSLFDEEKVLKQIEGADTLSGGEYTMSHLIQDIESVQPKTKEKKKKESEDLKEENKLSRTEKKQLKQKDQQPKQI